jgi:hypothetical protein
MDLERFTDKDLLQALEAECAKSLGELKCAQGDLNKMNSRLKFILLVVHKLKERLEDEKI